MADVDTQDLKRGSALLVGGQAVQAMVAFGVNLVLVRYLAPDEFGRFALLLSGAALAYGIFTVRCDALIIRVSDAAYDRQTQERFFSLITLETLVSTVLISLWLMTTDTFEFWSAGLVAALAGRHWLTQNKAFYERRMLYSRLAMIETGAALAGHVLALGLILNGFGWKTLFLREAFLTVFLLLCQGAIGAITWRRFRWLSGEEWKGIYREARGIWLDSLLENSFQRVTVLLAGVFGGAHGAGLFFQAQRLAMVPNQFLSPIASRVAGNWFGRTEDPDRRRAGRNRLLVWVSVPMFAGGLVCVLFGPALVPWLFGEPWARSGDLLAAMGGVVAFVSLFEVLKAYCWITRQMTWFLVGRGAQYVGLAMPLALAATGELDGDMALALGQSVAFLAGFIVVGAILRRREQVGRAS